MTTDIIELSKQAAEVLEIEPIEIYPSHFSLSDNTIQNFSRIWLAEDSGRCADIAIERNISTNLDYEEFVMVAWDFFVSEQIHFVEVSIEEHNGDRKQAWRVAVLKAAIEQGEK